MSPKAEASPLVITRTRGSVRISWDNREVPKSWLLLVVFLVAAAMFGTFGSFLLLSGGLEFGCVGLVFLGPALLIVYGLSSRWWLESVELSTTTFSYYRKGLFAPGPKQYALGALVEVSVGYYPSGEDGEGTPTLNLIHANASVLNNRTIFGYWLPLDLQRQVFAELQKFAREAGLSLKFVTHDGGEQPNQTPPPDKNAQ